MLLMVVFFFAFCFFFQAEDGIRVPLVTGVQTCALPIFYRADGRHVRLYNSPIQIVGMPLSSMGGRAHGVIAYGGLATGIIAVGGVSAGVISFGGISVGFLSLGGLSVGWLTLGAGAVGWRAIGAVAVGQAALGSLVIGRWAYAGPGVALGRDESSGGKQKESLIG